MSVYSYPKSKIVDEIVFKKSEGGAMRAYVHARDGVEPAVLEQVIDEFKKSGWQCTPFTHNGKSVLEVRDFKSEGQVLSTLSNKEWVEGERWHRPDKEDKISFKERLKKRSLWASAVSFIVADTGFYLYGRKEFSHLDAAGGLSYLSGTLASLIFSRKDPSDIQIRDIAKQMAKHLKEQKIDTPADSALGETTKDPTSPIKRIDNFMRRYPSEAMNLIYVVAGACIATAAYKHKIKGVPAPRDIQEYMDREIIRVKKYFPATHLADAAITKGRAEIFTQLNRDYKREGWMDVALGASTMSSGLFGAFVTEKARDPDAPRKHGLAGAWEWMQERPLAISSFGYMFSTACHAVSTSVAWNSGIPRRKKSVPYRAAFITFTAIGEVLLAISSKGHGHGVKSDGTIDHTIFSMAAEIINQQPSQLHGAIIEQTAKFLARPDVLAINDKKATEQLRHEVELMRKNPWAVANRPQKLQSQPRGAVAAILAEKKTEIPTWQSKVAAAKPDASPQISA